MIRKAAVFVDGENLVFRYQHMVDGGRTPRPDVTHIRDVFVWQADVLRMSMIQIDRLSYYTFAVGDDDRVSELGPRKRGHVMNRDKIWNE